MPCGWTLVSQLRVAAEMDTTCSGHCSAAAPLQAQGPGGHHVIEGLTTTGASRSGTWQHCLLRALASSPRSSACPQGGPCWEWSKDREGADIYICILCRYLWNTWYEKKKMNKKKAKFTFFRR